MLHSWWKFDKKFSKTIEFKEEADLMLYFKSKLLFGYEGFSEEENNFFVILLL